VINIVKINFRKRWGSVAYNAGIGTLVAYCHWWVLPDMGQNSLPPTKSEFNSIN